MILGICVKALCGLLCIVLGLILWLKQKIGLLHDYHYQNVIKEDVPAYCKKMGIGLICIGAGVCISMLFDIFGYQNYFYIPLIIGFGAGFTIMHKAQKKYNGSWFS